MARPTTLARSISPPPSRKGSRADACAEASPQALSPEQNSRVGRGPSLAAIEAGREQIRDHLEYFTERLQRVAKAVPGPCLGFDEYRQLYRRNERDSGHHFVVHQHDHPIAGVHYDLRLQFSNTSTISFAIPYGMPGNPNSARPNRMAIETRVHNLWNNLIESASHVTGSLLIWDTGEYEILPWKEDRARMTDDEFSADDAGPPPVSPTESEKLVSAFQGRHIRLRLHGSRLPAGYTISLRLPSRNDVGAQPRKPVRKRRRLDPTKPIKSGDPASTDSDPDSPRPGPTRALTSSVDDSADGGAATAAAAMASDDEANEDTAIRANNAYTGATNSIGSIHQRHWFLTLDRRNSGFVRAGGDGSAAVRSRWVGPWEAFFVCGRDVERSIVTGRCADEVMADENVSRFVGRKMWRPILE